MITKKLALLFSSLFIGLSLSFAQKNVDIDFDINIGKDDKSSEESDLKYPRSFGGLTFTRIDWGFSRLSDEGSFTLSENNQFMSYKKSSNFGFDIAQYGVRLNDNFKIYLSAGFEWNYWRLKNDILIKESVSPVTVEPLNQDVDYKKNVFTSTYMRVPLTFEWRSNVFQNKKRLKIAFGAMTGVLMKGTQRLKSEENGKQKFKDTFNLQTFQYGPFIRFGYENAGIYAKYYMNDLFEKSPNQEGLRNLAFGLTFGF
ncbi:outer membrane beta-barrel protein [Sphingobacterium sp. HJSM2_6]|uniref:outer membrane beta-barrel protein n=1 Tax=Sphingobacterium sp. HJSM2_6 TaxID=3366264 RepID=UPI003BCDFBAC